LLSLDQPEHPDPKLRPESLPAERRSAGVIPRNGGRLRSVHFDHVAGERWLVGTIGDDRPSSIAASAEAPFSRANSMERSKRDECH